MVILWQKANQTTGDKGILLKRAGYSHLENITVSETMEMGLKEMDQVEAHLIGLMSFKEVLEGWELSYSKYSEWNYCYEC